MNPYAADINRWENELAALEDHPAPDLVRIADLRRWIEEAFGRLDYDDLDDLLEVPLRIAS